MNEAADNVRVLAELINPQSDTWSYFSDLHLIRPIEIYEPGGQLQDALFKAVCSCGQSTTVLFSDAYSRRVKNCGKCTRMFCAEHSVGWFTRRRPLRAVYNSMLRRCRMSPSPLYRSCGQLGVGFDSRWSCYFCFEADLGPRPRGADLLRRDPLGDYSPENCFWSDPPCCA